MVDSEDSEDDELIAKIDLKVTAWSAGDSPVLEINQGESKWIILGGSIPVDIMRLINAEEKGVVAAVYITQFKESL